MSLTDNITQHDQTPGTVYEDGEILVRYEQGVGRLPGLFAAKVAGQAIAWVATLERAIEIAEKHMGLLQAARAAMRQVDVFTDKERDDGASTAIVIAPQDPELVAEVGAAYVRQMPADERPDLWRAVSLRFAWATFHLQGTAMPRREQVLESLRRPWVTEVHDG